MINDYSNLFFLKEYLWNQKCFLFSSDAQSILSDICPGFESSHYDCKHDGI